MVITEANTGMRYINNPARSVQCNRTPDKVVRGFIIAGVVLSTGSLTHTHNKFILPSSHARYVQLGYVNLDKMQPI